MFGSDVFPFSNKTLFGSRNWFCWRQVRQIKYVKIAKTKLLCSKLSEKIPEFNINSQTQFKDKYKIQRFIGNLSLSMCPSYPSPTLITKNKSIDTWYVGIITSILPVHLIFRAITVFIRMHFSIIFKGNGNLKGKIVEDLFRSMLQAFVTTQSSCHNKLMVPLLSPLNFFSSRLSCASYSLSNSICSIWASIRSLEVSVFSPVINGPSATLFKIRQYN